MLELVGAFLSPRAIQFFLAVRLCIFLHPLRRLFLLDIVHHATDAEWSVVVRRQLENIALLLPVHGVLFIPVCFCGIIFIDWMNIPPGSDPVLDAKRAYLNWKFFLFRAVFFFAFFIVVGLLAPPFFRPPGSRRQSARSPSAMRKVAFVGLPLFALCLTFGAFDWLMSLNYHWFSTMWGPYIFAGAAGSSMSLLVLVITALRKAGYLKDVVTIEHYHIMGKWMLAFTVFWAYIGFSQYMLYWYANIPEETQYFILRNTESWWLLSILLVIGRFFVPFAFCSCVRSRNSRISSAMIAGWIIFMQLLDMYIIVLPALHGTGVHLSIWDFLPLIGIGATLAFFYLRIVGKTSLFPVRDPRLIESLRLTN